MALVVPVVLVLGVAGLVGLGYAVRWSLRPVPPAAADDAAALGGVTLTEASRPCVVEALSRARRWRSMGVFTVLAVAAAAMAAQAAREQAVTVSLLLVLWCLVGYYVGSVLAEVRTAQRGGEDVVRAAQLTRRELSSYVGRWAQRWPRALGAVGVAAAALGWLLGNRDAWLVAVGVGSGLAAAVTAAVSRYVLERPQAVESADLTAADDVVRSRSLHAIAGAGIGIQTWLTALAVGGLVLAAWGGTQPELDRSVAVWTLFAVVIPLAGTMLGRHLSRRPFALSRDQART